MREEPPAPSTGSSFAYDEMKLASDWSVAVRAEAVEHVYHEKAPPVAHRSADIDWSAIKLEGDDDELDGVADVKVKRPS